MQKEVLEISKAIFSFRTLNKEEKVRGKHSQDVSHSIAL
jgi:hypothetical protein